MTAHALVHGGLVGLITGDVRLAVAETIAHWLIDFGRCEGRYGFYAGQMFHVVCKVAWVVVLL